LYFQNTLIRLPKSQPIQTAATIVLLIGLTLIFWDKFKQLSEFIPLVKLTAPENSTPKPLNKPPSKSVNSDPSVTNPFGNKIINSELTKDKNNLQNTTAEPIPILGNSPVVEPKPNLVSPLNQGLSSQYDSGTQKPSPPSSYTSTPDPINSLDRDSRAHTADRLKLLGLDIDWRQYSLSDMLDMESRIKAANRLASLGLDADWHSYPLGDLLNWESRIKEANSLKTLGYSVDWKNYSLDELLNLESQVRATGSLHSIDQQNQ
jgi:hypothetical protein